MTLSFGKRVLVLLGGLVVLVQMITLFAVLQTIERDVTANLDRDLDSGSALIRQLIDRRSELLVNGATVLAADFGFKSAIASGDPNTILSALENNIGRIDADIAGLVSLDNQLVASTAGKVDPATFVALATDANKNGLAVDTIVIAGQARQVVSVPVKAPLTVGWLVLGFSLDDAIAETFRNQVRMHVTFSARGSGDQFFGSTLSESQRQAMAQASDLRMRADSSPIMRMRGEAFLTRKVPLGKDNGRVEVILQNSLDVALSGYRDVRKRLLILVALALLVALILAGWFARTVTKPVALLSEAAKRVMDGKYDEPLSWHRADEIGDLVANFGHMQQGIAEREETISHQAYHDDLTDLPNRRLVHDRLQKLIALTADQQQSVAVIMIGINRFSIVVETLGHSVGDRVLVSLADRLRARCTQFDSVARVSTDEFVLVMESVDSHEVKRVLQSLLIDLAQPIALDSAELVLDVAAGVALTPQHASTADDAMRRASIALADAREASESIGFYEYGRDESHLRRLSIVADLKRAVACDELTLFYQPKINMQTHAVDSVEALVRWVHPEHGFMNPAEFIELAERSGIISMLSNWVLNQAISQIAAWSESGIELKVAVNLSALDLQDERLPMRIDELLLQHKVDASRLILEVTESAMMRDTDRALICLNTLRAGGKTISIDDFGTGYSSLAKLKDLPIDELKIDRSFVTDITSGSEKAQIIQAIIELGHSLGLKVITEGVETLVEWNVLKDLNNDVVQGYLITKPLTVADFSDWWHQFQSEPFDNAA